VITKGGHHRARSGDRDAFVVDGRPETLRRQCDESLRALGVDRIGLYLLHKPDPHVPVAQSVEALADLQEAGKVAAIGLSNVSVEQLGLAVAVAPVAAVQNHLSLQDRDDREMVDSCAQRGIAYLAYSPLGGRRRVHGLTEAVPGIATVAERHGVSPAQVAVAWLLAQSPGIGVVVGARRPASIADSAAGAELVLDSQDLLLLAG
jgi:aryl-alcohol dehydrogenase-like predicted oxidoreductase